MSGNHGSSVSKGQGGKDKDNYSMKSFHADSNASVKGQYAASSKSGGSNKQGQGNSGKGGSGQGGSSKGGKK